MVEIDFKSRKKRAVKPIRHISCSRYLFHDIFLNLMLTPRRRRGARATIRDRRRAARRHRSGAGESARRQLPHPQVAQPARQRPRPQDQQRARSPSPSPAPRPRPAIQLSRIILCIRTSLHCTRPLYAPRPRHAPRAPAIRSGELAAGRAGRCAATCIVTMSRCAQPPLTPPPSPPPPPFAGASYARNPLGGFYTT